jgi:hypothetical protein
VARHRLGTAEIIAALRSTNLGTSDDAERTYRRDLKRYARSVGRLRTRAFAGGVGVVATIVAAVPDHPWWLVGTAACGWVGGTAVARLRGLRAPQPPPPQLAAAPGWPVRLLSDLGLSRPRSGLGRTAVGAEVADRLVVAEANLKQLVPAVQRLHPSAGAELSTAVTQASPLLHQQVERLLVLDGLARDLPGSPAGEAAVASARQVAARLGTGVDAYEGLLAAAATLLGAPDLGRSVTEVLGPAVEGMQSYTHGLATAGEP